MPKFREVAMWSARNNAGLPCFLHSPSQHAGLPSQSTEARNTLEILHTERLVAFTLSSSFRYDIVRVSNCSDSCVVRSPHVISQTILCVIVWALCSCKEYSTLPSSVCSGLLTWPALATLMMVTCEVRSCSPRFSTPIPLYPISLSSACFTTCDSKARSALSLDNFKAHSKNSMHLNLQRRPSSFHSLNLCGFLWTASFRKMRRHNLYWHCTGCVGFSSRMHM